MNQDTETIDPTFVVISEYLDNKTSEYVTKLNNEARKIGDSGSIAATDLAKQNAVKRLREYSVILKFLQDERKKY